MDVSRNSMLGELASDAASERGDYVVQATEQLAKFLDRNRDRISQLGGMTLIDDDPDYLSVAPDCTFRVRSRYEDPTTGEWVSETEIVETASELVELYNPAEVYAAFAEAAREAAGLDAQPTAADELMETAGIPPEETFGLGEAAAYAGAADEWAAGQVGGGRCRRRRVRRARDVQPRPRLPGAQPGQRGPPDRPVRGGRLAPVGHAGRPDHRGRRRRAPRAGRHGPLPRRGPARGLRRRVAPAHRSPRTSSSSTIRRTSSGTSPTPWPRRSRPSRPSSRTRTKRARTRGEDELEARRGAGERQPPLARAVRSGRRGQASVHAPLRQPSSSRAGRSCPARGCRPGTPRRSCPGRAPASTSTSGRRSRAASRSGARTRSRPRTRRAAS